jgi:Protein of unknown function (DUF1501)
MNPISLPMSRRELLERSGLGFGSLALAAILGEQIKARAESTSPADLSPRAGHFAPRAKAVIQLMMNGGPSPMDLFDPKPELTRRHGQPIPGSVETFQKGNTNTLMASPFRFEHHGECGMELSEVMPHFGAIADELCLIRSMFTGHNNHTEALVMMQTGKIFPGRPALGSWISYALGTLNGNLPAYVVLRDPDGYNTSGKLVWSSGWLPALFQGVELSARGNAVRYLDPARPVPAEARAHELELLSGLNADHARNHPREGELESRIRNFELAARMQLAAGELLDLSRETAATLRLYGLEDARTSNYGQRCLMARRLVEAGVRFVQVFPPLKPSSQPWDSHKNLKAELESICGQTDKPAAALVTDLKSRGLLDETIVMWTGEFGRLPVTQNANGRDHNRNGFGLFLAGGGFKNGHIHGASDEFGYRAMVDPVSVPDLHATVLNQLGVDHNRLVFTERGIDETPTDAKVSGAKVVKGLLA